MGITKSFTTRFCKRSASFNTYDGGLFLVEASLILLDALLAAEEDKAVTHVEAFVFAAVFLDQLVDALIHAVGVAAVVSVEFGICALGEVADQTQGVDVDLLSFGKRG